MPTITKRRCWGRGPTSRPAVVPSPIRDSPNPQPYPTFRRPFPPFTELLMAGVADKNALKAGVFITAAIALGMTVFFVVGGYRWGRDEVWTIRFDVADDVSGVGPGADVRIGGVAVGQVESVAVSDDFRHVDVKVTLPDDLTLRAEPRVVIQATVTGVAWLNFDSLGEGELIEPGSVIIGDAGTISNLVAAANRLAPAVTGLIDDVRGETLPQVNEVLGKTSRTMDSVEGTV